MPRSRPNDRHLSRFVDQIAIRQIAGHLPRDLAAAALIPGVTGLIDGESTGYGWIVRHHHDRPHLHREAQDTILSGTGPYPGRTSLRPAPMQMAAKPVFAPDIYASLIAGA